LIADAGGATFPPLDERPVEDPSKPASDDAAVAWVAPLAVEGATTTTSTELLV
jgi:hypothetical protein